MIKYYVLLFFMALTIPLLLGLNAWQSNECGKIKSEIRSIERRQENSVRYNKTIVNEIRDILAVNNLETVAQNMGLQKKKPEDVMLIIVGGDERGY